MNNQVNRKGNIKTNPFQFSTIPSQGNQITSKKITSDLSLNYGLNSGSNRNQSRNFQLPSGQFSSATAHHVAQTENQLYKFNNHEGSFLIHSKTRQSNSLTKYQTGQSRNQVQVGNHSFNSDIKGERIVGQSPENNQQQFNQEQTLSNKKMSPYNQKVTSNHGSILQSTGLVKDLRKDTQNNQILPPMLYAKQQVLSRNQAQKQSLSESIQNKMRGQSPKNLINQQLLKKTIEQDHEDANKRERSNSNLGTGKAPPKSRNTNINLGEGPLKPQFHSVRGPPQRTISNYHQSPSNNGNISRPMKQQLSPFSQQQQQQAQAVSSASALEAQFELDPLMILEQTYENAKYASKRNGVVVSYAANTHQGIVRNYNEDRVSIILNIIKPKFKEAQHWPRCSFFGVYDGHGGAACSDYLRDQLHQLIVKDDQFPDNPKKAIENAFLEAENTFLTWAEQEAPKETGQIDRSGSCANIILIVGDMCYIANVGDSRSIMSAEGGEKILILSKDHKPESDEEMARIELNGGRIYQNSNYVPDLTPGNEGQMQLIVGPHRVFPGRLSVSRTIGDIEAKLQKYGGNPKVVVPTPDIKSFKIRNNYDFIIMGCDGIFEKLNNQDVIGAVWNNSKLPSYLQKQDFRTIHEKCGTSVDRIMKDSVIKKTFDNITTVMIAFENFENVVGDSQQNIQEIKESFNQHQRLEAVEEELIENEDIDTPSLHNSNKQLSSKQIDVQKARDTLNS